MKRVVGRYFPQPSIAVVVAALAVACLLGSWAVAPRPASSARAEVDTILTLVLLATALLTYHFPIYIRLSSKVYMCGVVFFLMASLLPVPLAIAAVGLSTVAGELSVRSRTGNYPSDIVTIAGRGALIAAATSAVAHIPAAGGISGSLTFVAAAITMWVCEHLTYPLIYYPVTRESPFRIVKVLIREGGLIEASQLLVGLLGVIAASQQLWSLALLLLPTVLVYFSFKRGERTGRWHAQDHRVYRRYRRPSRSIHRRTFAACHRVRRRYPHSARQDRPRGRPHHLGGARARHRENCRPRWSPEQTRRTDR